MKRLLTLCLLLTSITLSAQKKTKKDYLITMETTKGTMAIILFDKAPLHKANFLKLAEEGFYENLLFHRVINEFMIQGGDPNSKNAEKGAKLGSGGADLEKVPFEFVPEHVHLKGSLAAARTNNPAKESSGCQFYIVTGKKYTDFQMTDMAKRVGLDYTEEQRKAYIEEGGTPFLDNNYTVFGKVIKGIEIAEEIEKVETDGSDRPIEDVSMKVSVKKMKKKKITKLYGYHYN
ncbi:MAG: peptidylprolyl isomerase [Cytophagales bacterium]|nr:peptidylprolyl isomerase [Cytophagales bacterium]